MESGPATHARQPAPIGEPGAVERCPSCDAPAAWQISRRHRYSPFGSALLAILAFWAALFGWLLGFGYLPALTSLGLAVFTGLATRSAEICEACGFVRPRGG